MTDWPHDEEGTTVWHRLRRRKVVQWGVAYAAGAWGLLQGAQFLAEIFDWPDRVLQLGTVAALIGLPIVLVLAWYHGDRGEQRVRGTELAIVTLLFLVGGGLFWRYHSTSEPSGATTTPAASVSSAPASAPADPRPSIAVLPFDNRSKLEDDVYFVDGIHDDILTQLSKVSGMRVISRTSVERFRDTKLPIKSIAEQLGVAQILEGGVQRAGDRVRVTVQLIDGNSDAHLWAETYDRDLTAANIFAIQSEVATAIAGALKATLTTDEVSRLNAIPTQNLEAWEAYQIGRQRLDKRTTVALADAEQFFRKAIDLDPRFALAWAGLADSLALQVSYGGRAADEGNRDAERAATRALEIDPNLAEAWAAAGGIAGNRSEMERSEQLLRKAITLNPNYARAHHWLSYALVGLGRREEALAVAQRAVELDPLSAISNIWLGNALEHAGRFGDALARYQKSIVIDPTMATGYWSIGDAYAFGLGRLDAAVPWYEKAASLDRGSPDLLASVAAAQGTLGNDAEARRWLTRMLALGEGTNYSNFVATVLFLERGELESARQRAELAVSTDPSAMPLILVAVLQTGDYVTARAQYEKAFPELFGETLPMLDVMGVYAAINLAVVLQQTGEGERATALLDRIEAYFEDAPRMGGSGYGLLDVAVHALRGDRTKALAGLREAEQAGWCGPFWRFYRDYIPQFASIRDEPEFKAVFGDIERDMARQRAALAARPKDAPLDVATTH